MFIRSLTLPDRCQCSQRHSQDPTNHQQVPASPNSTRTDITAAPVLWHSARSRPHSASSAPFSARRLASKSAELHSGPAAGGPPLLLLLLLPAGAGPCSRRAAASRQSRGASSDVGPSLRYRAGRGARKNDAQCLWPRATTLAAPSRPSPAHGRGVPPLQQRRQKPLLRAVGQSRQQAFGQQGGERAQGGRQQLAVQRGSGGVGGTGASSLSEWR